MKSILFGVLLVSGMTLTTNVAMSQLMLKPTDKYILFLTQFRQEYVSSMLKNNPATLQHYYA